MITSRTLFGMSLLLMALGVIGILGGLAGDRHYWSIVGGLLFGAGVAFLAMHILDNWGPDERSK